MHLSYEKIENTLNIRCLNTPESAVGKSLLKKGLLVFQALNFQNRVVPDAAIATAMKPCSEIFDECAINGSEGVIQKIKVHRPAFSNRAFDRTGGILLQIPLLTQEETRTICKIKTLRLDFNRHPHGAPDGNVLFHPAPDGNARIVEARHRQQKNDLLSCQNIRKAHI